MHSSTTKLRVRYGETDQMGYVYYGNYAQYFEVARVEALRELGISYKNMEEDGIMLPVVKFEVTYKLPARYDDELIIKTSISKLPTSVIHFNYEVFNQKNQLLNTANTSLVFVNIDTGKPVKAPKELLDKLSHLL